MLFLRKLLCLPVTPEELLPRSRNLSMQALLALSEKQARPDPRGGERANDSTDQLVLRRVSISQ